MKLPEEIKVLFVTHYNKLYGANKSLLQLIIELKDKGVRPFVLLPPYDAPRGNNLKFELDKHRIPYVVAPVRFDMHRDWKKVLANYALALYCRKKAYNAIKDLEFDLVHSNSSTISTGAYIAKKLRVPHIWHLREFGDLHYNLKVPFGKWYRRVIYKGNNTFIAVSDKIRTHYQKFIPRDKIHLIYNGVKSSAKSNPLNRERVEICIIGLLDVNKGQLEVLQAADELVNKRGVTKFHINIVGDGDTAYLDLMKRFTMDQGLDDFVTFLGRRNDVPDLLPNMDIGVMASLNEAFGRVTVEYMMAGLAVIASDSGANTEIVVDGENGLLYKKGDAHSLADKLEYLIGNRDARLNYAKKGMEVAHNKFSSVANSNAVFDLYKETLSKL